MKHFVKYKPIIQNHASNFEVFIKYYIVLVFKGIFRMQLAASKQKCSSGLHGMRKLP